MKFEERLNKFFTQHPNWIEPDFDLEIRVLNSATKSHTARSPISKYSEVIHLQNAPTLAAY